MKHWIEFPALGWHFPISDTLVEFSLFGLPVSIKFYGLLIALGFLLAAIYAFRRAPKLRLDKDKMFDVVLVAAIFAFIGARLYYVVFSENASYYFQNPIAIFEIWKGGLGIYGGIIFAFLTGLVMCRIRKLPALPLFDLAALGFLIGQGIGRWGNFFNQEAFGANTTLPWGMTGDLIQAGQHTNAALGVDGFNPLLPVHPTFLYESLWCLIGFVLLHVMSKKFYKFSGQIFASYIIWYGFGRFWIEGLRTDSLYIGSMRVSQLVAVIAVAGGIGLLFAFKAWRDRLPKTLVSTTEDEKETAEETPDGKEDDKASEQPKEETIDDSQAD